MGQETGALKDNGRQEYIPRGEKEFQATGTQCIGMVLGGAPPWHVSGALRTSIHSLLETSTKLTSHLLG